MLEVLFCWYKFSLQDLPALQTFVFQINYTQTEVTPAKTKSTFTPHIPTLDQIIKKGIDLLLDFHLCFLIRQPEIVSALAIPN